MYDVTFWQNSPSIHQAPLMAALAADGLRVRVVVPSADNAARRAMGWHRPDYGAATLCIADDLGTIRELAESARPDRAHVFTGLGSNRAVSTAFRTLAAGTHRHLSVMTESWDPRGARELLRRARYTARVLGSRRHIDSVLAIGKLAAAQFASAGIPAARIAQFIYSVSDAELPAVRDAAAIPEVIFVGTLSPRKDPLLLVEAVASLRDVRLTVVGSGPLRDDVRHAVSHHGLESRVRVCESHENAAVRALIARSDLLVLPSRYDGWGAVTNEALMVGTPAVVSDRSGSSLLVAHSNRGRVFRTGDVGSLASAISDELADGPPPTERRQQIRQWSQERISPKAVSPYLHQLLLEDVHTAPPWLAEQEAR
ncbi:glycosyltransferase family 4 protein [Georgenia sp. Marseille-Q6866]